MKSMRGSTISCIIGRRIKWLHFKRDIGILLVSVCVENEG